MAAYFQYSVYDSDGEFLLIEAAEALPAWVSPSNAENRVWTCVLLSGHEADMCAQVWLYRNHMHLIPIFYTSSPNVPRRRRQLPGTQDSDAEDGGPSQADDDEYLGVADALKILRDPSVDSVATSEVEARMWDRISKYAVKISCFTTRPQICNLLDILPQPTNIHIEPQPIFLLTLLWLSLNALISFSEL